MPRLLATCFAWRLSSCSLDSKPMEKVSVLGECLAANELTIELSRPPERNIPTGTSPISLDRTALSTKSSNLSISKEFSALEGIL